MNTDIEIQVIEEPIETLSKQGEISIAYEYDRIFEVTEKAGGFALTERVLDASRSKDYDLLDGPKTWSEKFDVASWGFIVARSNRTRIGGAVIAYGGTGLDMLEGRIDLAVLWDIRVAPEFRGRGVGVKLFKAVEVWALDRACRQLKIETQNTNLSASKFYARQGCSLGAVNRAAYTSFPNEIQMLWYRDLVPPNTSKFCGNRS